VFDAEGRLWNETAHGRDEVNLILPGRNFGWPRVSNGSNYDGVDLDHAPGDGYEAPKVWWNPSVSPGSLLIYTGDLFPQWKGDALIGALSGQALIHVRIRGDQASKADQWDMGARIRAVDQGPRGEVYLLEDGGGGRLLVMTAACGRSGSSFGFCPYRPSTAVSSGVDHDPASAASEANMNFVGIGSERWPT
jgi:glucose/arabinose dehydrogenase